MSIETIITGCRLVDPHGSRSVWGDLWEVDSEVYVFNAVLENGETAWKYEPNGELEVSTTEKQIWVRSFLPIFERRGVLVFPCRWAELNAVAEAYLRGRPIELG